MRHMILNIVANRVLALMADVRVAIEPGYPTMETGFAGFGSTASAGLLHPVVSPLSQLAAAGRMTGSQPNEVSSSKRWHAQPVAPGLRRDCTSDQTCRCRLLSRWQCRPLADATQG